MELEEVRLDQCRHEGITDVGLNSHPVDRLWKGHECFKHCKSASFTSVNRTQRALKFLPGELQPQWFAEPPEHYYVCQQK